MPDIFDNVKTEDYPEHEKLHKVKDKSQAIGDFIYWLRDKGIHLCVEHQHDDDCYEERGNSICRLKSGEFIIAGNSIVDLLAEFFDVNRDKLEAEKRTMLTLIRKQTG